MKLTATHPSPQAELGIRFKVLDKEDYGSVVSIRSMTPCECIRKGSAGMVFCSTCFLQHDGRDMLESLVEDLLSGGHVSVGRQYASGIIFVSHTDFDGDYGEWLECVRLACLDGEEA